MSDRLELTISNQYSKDLSLLGKPVSFLARQAGLTVNQVFDKLIPALSDSDLGEALKFTDTGLKYLGVVDKNRLREEVGLEFITALDLIINNVKAGLQSKEKWIVRKSMSLHGQLIDEASEKQRFVEQVMAEQRFNMIKEHSENIKKLQDEIIDFEKDEVGKYIPKNGNGNSTDDDKQRISRVIQEQCISIS